MTTVNGPPSAPRPEKSPGTARGTEPPLRIGLLTTYYPGEPFSDGIGAYMHTLATSCVAVGHSVFALLTRRPVGWQAEMDGVRLIGVGLADRVLDRRSAWRLPVFSLRVARLVRDLQLDVLETHEYGGEAAFIRFFDSTVPMVVRLHCSSKIVRLYPPGEAARPLGLAGRLRSWLERRSIMSADAVTSISSALLRRTNQVLDTNLNDAAVVPNPVDDAFFEVSGKDGSEPTIVFIGRLEWIKGPDVLAVAAGKLAVRHPSARFVLVGSDTKDAPGATPMLDYVQSLLTPDVRERFTFTGAASRQQVLEIVRGATICVIPSRWEGFSLPAAEAAAVGKPIVISSATGIAEWLHDGESALIVPPADADALAAAIDRLLTDADLRVRLGASARIVAERYFRADVVAGSILQVYRRVLNRRSCAAGSRSG